MDRCSRLVWGPADDDQLMELPFYSFHMNGQRGDRRYAFACPYEDDRPPWTDEAVIGELGLVMKHKFLYYFDYGDSHEFEIEVTRYPPPG